MLLVASGGAAGRPLKRFLIMERVGSVLDIGAVRREHDAAGARSAHALLLGAGTLAACACSRFLAF